MTFVPQILPWNLKKTHFQLEGNEILLILALVDICPSDSTLKFEKNTFSARGQWNFINFSSRWHLSLQNQGNVAKMNWIPVQHRRTKAISAFSWLHQLPSCPSPSNNIALGFGFGQLHRKKPTPTNRQHKFPLLESFGAPDSDFDFESDSDSDIPVFQPVRNMWQTKKTHNFAVLNARKERTSSQNSKLKTLNFKTQSHKRPRHSFSRSRSRRGTQDFLVYLVPRRTVGLGSLQS